MSEEIPASAVRADFAEIVNRVAYGGERVVITRHDRPLAALIPMADYELLTSGTEQAISPEMLAKIEKEAFERARREVYDEFHADASRRLEALMAKRQG